MSRVADGDSIEVETSSGTVDVRLAGVNAPERGECFAEEPRDYLLTELEDEVVGLEIVGTDQFGRVLAHVWLGADLVDLALVASGMAIALTPDEDDRYGGLLVSAEERAHVSGAGLWAASACGQDRARPAVRLSPERSVVDPPGPDGEHLDTEIIVIVNDGPSGLDLSGWTLRDESSQNRLVFPPKTMIAPRAELVIGTGCATEPGWCSDTPIWNNGGDMALLLDEVGTVVDRWRYP